MPIIKDTQVIHGQEITIYVEVDDIPSPAEMSSGVLGGPISREASRVFDVARDVFGDGMQLVQNCATRVVAGIQNMDPKTRPDTVSVQLAIKLDTEVGALLAKIGTEAQMQVTLEWKYRDVTDVYLVNQSDNS